MIQQRDNRLYHTLDRKAHRPFVTALRERWGVLERIRIGKEAGGRVSHAWCRDNLVGEYAYSEGREVFYFADHQDAILFKVRFQ